MDFGSATFWLALAEIVGVNIVLSGDNAVVIALACRSLPAHQQKQAIMFGSGAAIVLRVLLTLFAVQLLTLPWLKLVGAALLLWIGVKLLIPEDEGEGGGHATHTSMASAIKTVLVADLVMSLDNVIAVAAAAKGSALLLIIGLGLSIPLVIFGSTLLLRVMQRVPIVITVGGAILGYVAGEMAVSDPVVRDWIDQSAHWLHTAVPLAGLLVVVALGTWLARRHRLAADAHVVDIALLEDALIAGRDGSRAP